MVSSLRGIVESDDADARFSAIEALAAIARSGDPHPVRERASEAIVEILTEGSPDVRSAASPEARYVALERPSFAARIDDPYASILASGDPVVRRRVATDAGILLAEHGDGASMPATREALRKTLVSGTAEGRAAAAVAFVLLAEDPTLVGEPSTVAEHLAIIAGEREEPLTGEDSHLRRLADGRTLRDAVEAYGEAAGED